MAVRIFASQVLCEVMQQCGHVGNMALSLSSSVSLAAV
jgi:hypothetical protein